MGKQVFTNAALFLDGLDVSGDHNAVQLDRSADAVDVTTINMADRARLPGLRSFAASMAGLWEAGTNKINDQHLNAIGASAGTVLTLAPTGGAEGEAAMFGQLVSTSYAPGGSLGEAMAFQVAMQGSGDLSLGTILHNATRTGNGTSTIRQLAGVSTTKPLRAVLHVLAISGGGALTVTIQSDDAAGFASPDTKVSFAAKSAIGAEYQSFLAGTFLSDSFWRASWTLTGASPSATFVVVLQPQ